MMTPTLVLEHERPRLVIGSAGSVRLAGAIAQVTWRILRGMPIAEAIRAPRLHVEGATAAPRGRLAGLGGRAAPEGLGGHTAGAVCNLFFGGVQAAGSAADDGFEAAGDPRRAGRGHGRRVTTVQACDAARRRRARRARGERGPRGGALDPRHRPLALRRRTSDATCARSSATPTPPCSSPRIEERSSGGSRSRATRTRRAGTSPTSGSWSPRAIAGGESARRSSTRRSRGRAASGVRKLELHVFPWNEPALAALRVVRLRARGIPQAALRARRRARRRHPHGVLRGAGRGVALAARARALRPDEHRKRAIRHSATRPGAVPAAEEEDHVEGPQHSWASYGSPWRNGTMRAPPPTAS